MKTHKRWQIAMLYAMAQFLVPRAFADDSSAGVVLPAMRSFPSGSVKLAAASLVFKEGDIEVNLSIRATKGGSLTIVMPRFGWVGEAEPYPARHFPELQILVDGMVAPIENSFTAFVGTADVTQAIRTARIDPFLIADTPPFVNARPESIKELERLGAVERSGEEYLARWTAQRTMKVAIKSGSSTLRLKYKTRPGYGLLRFDQITSQAYHAQYCLSVPDMETRFGRSAADRLFAVAQTIIPLTIDGRPPPSVSVPANFVGEQTAQSLTAFCGACGGSVTVKSGAFRLISIKPIDR